MSSLAVAPWLSLDLSCDCPSLLYSPLAMVSAQVLSSACFCYVLAAFSENGAHLHSCNSCRHSPHLTQVGEHTKSSPSSMREGRFRNLPGPWLIWLGLSIGTSHTLAWKLISVWAVIVRDSQDVFYLPGDTRKLCDHQITQPRQPWQLSRERQKIPGLQEDSARQPVLQQGSLQGRDQASPG